MKGAARRRDWTRGWNLLEREKIMEHVIASYEVVPLLAEYSPRINAQQLKNALISREERDPGRETDRRARQTFCSTV